MKVLLVDDEVRLVTALARGLRAEGFEVEVAYDGLVGQELAQTQDFDVIVLDIMMPGKHGYAVCRDLRARGVETPILFLTAKDGELDEAEGLDLGADDYLTKPFHYVVLVARLKALARRAALASTARSETAALGTAQLETVQVGDLTVAPATRVAKRQGQPLELTAKEFDLLLFLASRAGQVVSKEELIDNLWDQGAPAHVNAVEAHISALRKKVDAPFTDKLLQTVRGVGYRLLYPTS